MAKFILGAALALVLTACGGGSSAPATPVASIPVAPASVPTPTPVHPDKLIVIGNSITLYTATDWAPARGLAASDLAHDYVHLVGHGLGFTDDNIQAHNVAVLERDPARTDLIFSSTDNIDDQSVVIVELGENTSGNDAWAAAFPATYSALLDAVAAKAPAKIICLSTYWQDVSLDTQKQAICVAHGGTWVDIAGIYYSNLDAIPAGDNPAYAYHPHDNSMAAMARAILAVK